MNYVLFSAQSLMIWLKLSLVLCFKQINGKYIPFSNGALEFRKILTGQLLSHMKDFYLYGLF